MSRTLDSFPPRGEVSSPQARSIGDERALPLSDLPQVRGSLKRDVPLAPYTWFRVGGAAEVLFIPADEADLAVFLSAIPQNIPVTVLGVASNVIVRDGGIPGIVVRLGPGFAKVEAEGTRVRAGAAALDRRVAKAAAKAGVAGLEFYAGIPGTIGGALRMNAGCYGTETKDRLVSAVALDRRGRRVELGVEAMGYSYRHSSAPAELIFTEALFEGEPGGTSEIQARMAEITARRESSQPIREKTGGSTFKNPPGEHAWQVVERVGGRGHRVGGAQMSELHCNFMINTGTASAADLEALGEEMRARAAAKGVALDWEIKRLGVKA